MPARSAIELLGEQMEYAYRAVRDRVDGLTDEEFFWKPVPEPWTVFQGEDGKWTYHYEEPDPVPAPFTTIAWRVVHIAMCKVMYHEYAFGPKELTWYTIETPSSVEGAIAMLEQGEELLEKDLASLESDDELQKPVLTNWGEEWPAWEIFWTMIWHDAHHGGEIAALRDLYRSSR